MKFRPYTWLVVMTLAMGSLGGCNTMAGVGEDVEEAGGAIEQGAEQNKPY